MLHRIYCSGYTSTNIQYNPRGCRNEHFVLSSNRPVGQSKAARDAVSCSVCPSCRLSTPGAMVNFFSVLLVAKRCVRLASGWLDHESRRGTAGRQR